MAEKQDDIFHEEIVVPGHVVTYDTRITDGTTYHWGHCSCGKSFRWLTPGVVKSYFMVHLQDALKANLKQQGKAGK